MDALEAWNIISQVQQVKSNWKQSLKLREASNLYLQSVIHQLTEACEKQQVIFSWHMQWYYAIKCQSGDWTEIDVYIWEVYGLRLSVNGLFVKEVDVENHEVGIQIQGKEQPGKESF